MSGDQTLAGRHQRLLEWDEVELPAENPEMDGAASPDARRGPNASGGREEPQSRMEKLRSILNRKIG